MQKKKSNPFTDGWYIYFESLIINEDIIQDLFSSTIEIYLHQILHSSITSFRNILCNIFIISLLLHFCVLSSRVRTLLRCVVQLLTATLNFLSAKCVLWPGFVLIKNIYFGPLTSGNWAFYVLQLRCIITRCTICTVRCPLDLIEVDTLAAVAAHRYGLDGLRCRTS